MALKEAEVVWFGSRSYVDEKYADMLKYVSDSRCKMHG